MKDRSDDPSHHGATSRSDLLLMSWKEITQLFRSARQHGGHRECAGLYTVCFTSLPEHLTCMSITPERPKWRGRSWGWGWGERESLKNGQYVLNVAETWNWVYLNKCAQKYLHNKQYSSCVCVCVCIRQMVSDILQLRLLEKLPLTLNGMYFSN